MTVDTYAVCPCGSGKKIKFCKCKDSVGELDRVLKMVEGGQVVPALDRLSKILAEHPDAAWALAVRGRLLMDLQEYESLSENAERFIRLQPSNPLALTQRAASLIYRGQIDEATVSMLDALTESGREVDAFVLDVASVLAFSLAQQGEFLSARVYASLAMLAQGYEGSSAAMHVLRQLNSAPSISHYLKSVPEPLPRPIEADWGERFDEASGLLHSNKVMLAQSKFESLRRTHPNEPSILTGLLTCAIWRGDSASQSDLLIKLSACESLEFNDRVRYRALAALVRPEMPELSVPVFRLTADIHQADEAELALTADSRFLAVPAEIVSEFHSPDEEVPPRAVYQLLDRDKPSRDEDVSAADIPLSLALVFVYGRQTDRAARVDVRAVLESSLDEARSRLSNALGSISLDQQPDEPIPLVAACQPAAAILRQRATPADAEKRDLEFSRLRMPARIAQLPLGILDGATLQSASQDSSKLLDRAAVVRILESIDMIPQRGDSILDEVRRLAGVDELPPLRISGEEVEEVRNEDLNRVELDGLDTEAMIYLLRRAQQISSTPAARRIAAKLVESDLQDDQKPVKLLAYSALINAAPDSETALATLETAKEFAETNGFATSNLLLTEVGLRISIGDGPGFQKTIETLTTRYGRDPEVMARVQQLLISFGLIRPDGSPRSVPQPHSGLAGVAPESAAASGSGLWTPESAAPAESGGGSKLWIPGMD